MGFRSLFPMFPPHTLASKNNICFSRAFRKKTAPAGFCTIFASAREAFATLGGAPRHGARIGKSLMVAPL